MTEWMRRVGQREADIAYALRGQAVSEIDQLGTSYAAEKLGLTPDSVRRLKMRCPWSLEEAFRVTDALCPNVADRISRVVHLGGTE